MQDAITSDILLLMVAAITICHCGVSQPSLGKKDVQEEENQRLGKAVFLLLFMK